MLEVQRGLGNGGNPDGSAEFGASSQAPRIYFRREQLVLDPPAQQVALEGRAAGDQERTG